MLSHDQFEMALKKDRNDLFMPNPNLQPSNDLFRKPVAGFMSDASAKSRRDEIWEAKKKRREEKSAFPKDLIGGMQPQSLDDGPMGPPMQIQREAPAAPTFSQPTVLPPPISYEPPMTYQQAPYSPQPPADIAPETIQPPQMYHFQRPPPTPEKFIANQMSRPPLPPPSAAQRPPVERVERQVVEQMDPEVDKKRRYLDELKQQLAMKEQKAKDDKNMRLNKERAELQAYEANNPFGKAGGGAPLRDKYGNIITNRKPATITAANQPPQLQNQYAAPPSYAPPSYQPPPPRYQVRANAPTYAPYMEPAAAPSYEEQYAPRPPSPQYYGRPAAAAMEQQYNAPTMAAAAPQQDYYHQAYEPPPRAMPESMAAQYGDMQRRPMADEMSMQMAAQRQIGEPMPRQMNEPMPMPAMYANGPPERPRIAPPPPEAEPQHRDAYAPDYVTRVYDPDKEVEKKRRAAEMQRALAEQVGAKKRLQQEEKKKKDLEERQEEEKIMRERKEMEEQYKREQDEKKKKVEDFRAANMALAEEKLNKPKTSKRRQIIDFPAAAPAVENKVPDPAPMSQERKKRAKNDLFGGPADDKPKNDLFGNAGLPAFLADKGGFDAPPQPIKETDVPSGDKQQFFLREPSHEVSKETIDRISQTKIINEISEKLRENINNQLLEMRQQMEQQQKHLMGELGNMKIEAKEALDKKALAQDDIAHFKSEMDGRKKWEDQYDKQLIGALSKNYDAKPRPDSKSRALMSRGKDNKEMKTYEKLYFNNIETGAAGGQKYPIKLYGKAGDTIASASSTLNQAEGSLKAESKLIDIGCIDPNKSLYYIPGETGMRKTVKKAEDSVVGMENTKKAVDTLDFLDKIAGVQRQSTAERAFRKSKAEAMAAAAGNTVTSEDSSVAGDPLKVSKHFHAGGDTIPNSLETSALNSTKLHEINRLNNQRLEELASLSKKEEKAAASPGDELDKLDNLLLDIIQSEKNGTSKAAAEDSLKSLPGKKGAKNTLQRLDAIHEAEMEDSIKGSVKHSLKGTSQIQALDTANLQLPSLKE